MSALGWGAGGEAWSWKRSLWVWEEEMVEECRILVDIVVVHDNVSDRWQWDSDTNDGYTMKVLIKF
ncbi:hypothetical protein MtrunA17_Chr4g0071401 [Medicago truncatula]|uniref:Uncharacterized protein n=1 Tax=Medicago truncatula TaxID=3880 RepID=A0A396IK00_MEDTR|nr:hypothetical protein MtrunA17_Chr4g0071401 [Medicago truncatula]